MTTGIMSKEERDTATSWIQKAIEEEPPFSFRYNGITSDQLLKKWQVRRENISKTSSVPSSFLTHFQTSTVPES